MRYKDKIDILMQLVQTSLPLSIDYKPHNGAYKIEMPVPQAISVWREDSRIATLQGFLEKNKISVQVIIKDETLLEVMDLPLVEKKKDSTPVFQIIKDSIIFAKAAVGIPDLYRILQQIDKSDYPFRSSDDACIPENESAFMLKIACGYTNPNDFCAGTTQRVTAQSSRLREAIGWVEEPQLLKSIHATLKDLKKYLPAKEITGTWAPDLYTYEYTPECMDEIISQQAIILNTCHEYRKEKFLWDYFKLNVLLSNLEYERGGYLLMNQWKISEIQKWLAEYRSRGYYESVAGKSGIVFIIKNTAKSPFQILDASGQIVKTPLRRNKRL